MRDSAWEDIFKLSASAAASEFCEWVQVRIDIYPSLKLSGQISLISMIFSCLCCCHSSYKIFFCLYQKDKSSESKVKFRQASNCCKRVLEAAKLAYANRTKESITSQKLCSQDFWQIVNSVLNKRKSTMAPLFIDPEVLSFASDKAKLFSENFSKNSNFDDPGISLPVFPSRTNLKLHNISVTPKMFKRVICF